MRYIIILLIFIPSLVMCADAPDKVCTQEEAMQAEAESSTLKDWDNVYSAFKHFAHCDDGAISEGYSDTIARLLTHNWIQISEANELISKDQKFEHFVLRHIDELMSPDQAKAINENARHRCPAGAEQLCKLIASRLSEVKKAVKGSKL